MAKDPLGLLVIAPVAFVQEPPGGGIKDCLLLTFILRFTIMDLVQEFEEGVILLFIHDVLRRPFDPLGHMQTTQA